ncbi:MAG: DUF192 domain-containing protein [Actinomycetota bacterium]|nr:DUF192 domain-containing protein [Actinomycetota bacterium]
MPTALEVQTTGFVLASDVRWATTTAERAQGLIGRERLAFGQALILTPAKQVHTYGMTYPIDVVFCDAKWTVKHVRRRMRPRRMTRVVIGSRYAIELPGGAVPTNLRRGDALTISRCSGRSGGRHLVDAREKGLVGKEEPEPGRLSQALAQES